MTEDRKHYGLILIDDMRKNITLATSTRLPANGMIDESRN